MRLASNVHISLPTRWFPDTKTIRDAGKLEMYKLKLLEIDLSADKECYWPNNRIIPLTRVHLTAFAFIPMRSETGFALYHNSALDNDQYVTADDMES